MAIAVGKEELLIIIGATGAASALLTVLGRWSGRRAARIEAAKDEAKKEQKEIDRLERLEQWRAAHTDQTEPLIEEFRDYRSLVQKTALNVEHLTARVRELVDSNRQVLGEMRNVNQTLLRLLSGGNSARGPGGPGVGSG